jgi:hypothetical protein
VPLLETVAVLRLPDPDEHGVPVGVAVGVDVGVADGVPVGVAVGVPHAAIPVTRNGKSWTVFDPASIAGAKAAAASDCCPFDPGLLFWPTSVTGGAQGPEASVPSICQSAQYVPAGSVVPTVTTFAKIGRALSVSVVLTR